MPSQVVKHMMQSKGSKHRPGQKTKNVGPHHKALPMEFESAFLDTREMGPHHKKLHQGKSQPNRAKPNKDLTPTRKWPA